ncbi:MAG: histidine phosphatase family protein [Propionicimonas sp.]
MTVLYLVRHGQTEWTQTGRHTSVTDLDLTEEGVAQARSLRDRLDPSRFDLVLSSPRLRARRTAELAGFGDHEVDEDLAEWSTASSRLDQPADPRNAGRAGASGSTDARAVSRPRGSARLTRVVAGACLRRGQAICFGHGHASRVLALCWLDFPIIFGQSFRSRSAACPCSAAKESPAILRWNS